MALTTSQAQAIASAVASDTTLAALAAVNGWPQIAAALNAASSPAVTIFRPDVPTSSILSAISAADMPATAGMIGYVQMMLSVGTVDATSATVRAGFAAAFTGKTTTLAALTAAAQRTATRFEALFVTASVSTAYGLTVSADDVKSALGK
jgi:hypothetical protein